MLAEASSPVKIHWGYPDPSNAPADARHAAFEQTRQAIGTRMRELVQIPFESYDDAQLRAARESI